MAACTCLGPAGKGPRGNKACTLRAKTLAHIVVAEEGYNPSKQLYVKPFDTAQAIA